MKLRIIVLAAILAVGLGVYLVVPKGPPPEPPPEPRPFVWSVEMTDLERIAVSLPREDKGEAWVKREDQYWYFEGPDGPKVDMQRWGGGVPLLLSGPGAERLVVEEATPEQIELYGFGTPSLSMEVTVEDGTTLRAEVGEPTPDGRAYYVRMAGSARVYVVDYTWYDVLAKLVRDPPYPKSGG